MANAWFQFKQFTIQQEKSAMKVCTDACIFGAYIASEEKDRSTDETNILDIGTGTGLLSLMIAQKVKGRIEAVEIDEKSYRQAEQNFIKSPWQDRLSVYHADIKGFVLNKEFNIMVSNPPFFESSLKSGNAQINIARHTESLTYRTLATIVFSRLTNKGRFYILLPCKEFEVFEKIAVKNQLVLIKKTHLRSNPSREYFRTAGVFTNIPVLKVTTELLTIRNDANEYSPEFILLLKDYYLHL